MPRRRSTRVRRRVSRYGGSVRRVARRGGRARGKIGSFLKTGIIGDTTQALGAGMLASIVTNRVAPQFTPYATLGAEYLAGGVAGTVLAEGIKSFTGQPSILNSLGGILGGGSNGGQTSSGDSV